MQPSAASGGPSPPGVFASLGGSRSSTEPSLPIAAAGRNCPRVPFVGQDMDLTCPKCQASMRSYERSGITVDQCTECRGIFLDRGELEKLMDAETSWQESQPSQPPVQQAAPSYQQQDYRQQDYREQDYRQRDDGSTVAIRRARRSARTSSRSSSNRRTASPASRARRGRSPSRSRSATRRRRAPSR